MGCRSRPGRTEYCSNYMANLPPPQYLLAEMADRPDMHFPLCIWPARLAGE
jgi:hypothetical protein